MIKRKKRNPKMARRGMANAMFKHGGYVTDLMSDDERKQYREDWKTYLDAYPYLNEPVMTDLLKRYLIMKIRLQRLEAFLMDRNIVESDKLGAQRLANDLARVMSLLATRMGITYVSRQRRKEKIKRKTPLEIMEDEEE